MKRLLLLRHAKAVRDASFADDALRPLARRGREDAAALGRFLEQQRCKPALVLCSSARRTRETLDLLLAGMTARPDVRFLDELYLAEAAEILSVVRHAHDSVGALMIVGHNSGLEDCALQLVGPPRGEAMRERCRAMAEKFPTGALAVIEFSVAHWADIAPDCGTLRAFVRGRDFVAEA